VSSLGPRVEVARRERMVHVVLETAHRHRGGARARKMDILGRCARSPPRPRSVRRLARRSDGP
jgi:hypothetical protein